jgi:SecD/SecF fusion protein
VADSALVAIIASLLVISAYVALRFEWKFAVPVLIALMHDLLITAGVYSLTGREVTTATVAALLTILGYSLYDTIIVFDRVRENVPRMPRAAFSQIVNRSMSEVLTRSIATTSCTLMPILALLLFGGATLKDFAFALLIGVASGAYSSIFIASPVLTHWKERERGFRARRHRIEAEQGVVPAYAVGAADVDPTPKRGRVGRLTTPEPETVSAAEFEQMKRDVEIERQETAARAARGSSTRSITKRLARSADTGGTAGAAAGGAASTAAAGGAAGTAAAAKRGTSKAETSKAAPKPAATPVAKPDGQPAKPAPAADAANGGAAGGGDGGVGHAPDIAENEGVSPVQKPKTPSKSKSRNRRHGRRR